MGRLVFVVALVIASGLPLVMCEDAWGGDALLLCGREEVFVVDPAVLASGKLEKFWSWEAAGKAGLPPEMVRTFASTDECKPIRGGRQILVTSSSGGCALVDYPSGEVKWFARVANAHSIELLPGDRVVVAGSVHKEGNLLAVFDLGRSNEPIWTTELVSAHGVVWDDGREALWALGLDELRRYELKDWETDSPSLKLVATHALPDESGHDLLAVPGSDDLLVTTANTVSLFDRDQGTFRPHPELKDKAHVKGATIHPKTGKTFYVEALGEGRWWSNSVRSLTPPRELSTPGEDLYKVRWLLGE